MVLQRLLLILIGSVLLAFGLVGCGPEMPAASCSACGDGDIVCSPSLADCIADNGGVCVTTLGADGTAKLTLHSDQTYEETYSGDTTTGTWNVDLAGGAVDLHAAGGPVSLVGVYEDGHACPYVGGAQ